MPSQSKRVRTQPKRITAKQKKGFRQELPGAAFLAGSVLCLAILVTPSAGAVGDFLKRMFLALTGEGRFLLPVFLAVTGVLLIRQEKPRHLQLRLWGAWLLYAVTLFFLHLGIPLAGAWSAGRAGRGGGLIGAAGSLILQKSFGLAGTWVILLALGLMAVLCLTDRSLTAFARHLSTRVGRPGTGAVMRVFDYFFPVVEEPEIVDDKPVIVDHTQGRNQTVLIFDAPAGPEPPAAVADQRQSLPTVVIADTIDKPRPKTGTGLRPAGDGPPQPALPANYELPPLTLLHRPQHAGKVRSTKDINESIHILEETLDSFGVRARVTQVSRGPAITRYEIQPPPGIKVSRIVGLADDIALSMAAPDVRIEAPIPGKAAVGIEVPNKEIAMVHLIDLLETEEFQKSPSRLTMALGKDIAGKPIVADLAKMPHLLIAGATGAGKSVCLNTLIASILFKARPDEVRFLLIDPKMVEMTMYNGIPHLISPVVTDVKKAASSLRRTVQEMEHRYSLFAAAGVREITRFNRHCRTAGTPEKLLPYILVVIDELADLMMVAPADVEDAVCRLAQMARAAGIHLLVATQRPSVDVITGLIKANIPSRISFAVSSQVDSRTILDMPGAEKLLGKGDMLFYPVGAGKPVRIQGAYLSDRDVENLVSFLQTGAEPHYEEQFTRDETVEAAAPEVEDDLLPQAVEILIEHGTASISMLQRRLHIGYARAARLIDIMERRGIVGGFEGSKPRTMLMTLEQFHQQFRRGSA
ncbi:MAG: DNA translocase FtsK 4TM domain-containing protein [Peptococcaceae bacterium]|jgi:S-DNA-T family DNA segregation ATPase FtsK/SpoIIIE|nr:DNA translocase FtsK 4TM domain-containing protein [Peptococcaceae bacterium]